MAKWSCQEEVQDSSLYTTLLPQLVARAPIVEATPTLYGLRRQTNDKPGDDRGMPRKQYVPLSHTDCLCLVEISKNCNAISLPIVASMFVSSRLQQVVTEDENGFLPPFAWQ